MDVGPIDLPWLPMPPADFREQVRRIRGSTDSGDLPRTLAGYRLSTSQLHLLAKATEKLAETNVSAIRLGVLSNATTDHLLPPLAASALRHGLWVRTLGTAFDQVAAEALDPESAINRARCQFVLVAVDHRGLPISQAIGDRERSEAVVNEAIGYIESIRHGLRAASGCTVILQTVPQVANGLFGSLDRQVPGTLQWIIDRFNQELRSRLAGSSDLLLDAAALAETVGLAQWHDPTQWALGKFPFSHKLVPLYTDWVARLLAAARGTSRKCLVLDLDNTLWGGVIGDDGLAGIVLGNGNPTGEAYLAVQRAVLALRQRGIILAVSSKNDDAVARSPFRSHPEMLLKEEHIAVFQANWQDKASNLQAIASALNIGLDALVLLDDNPAERAQVRAALPAVAVPELADDPAFYADALLAAGYFEAVRFTAEDRDRADQYEANVARAASLGAATDLDSYLESLQMRASFKPFDAIGLPRIAQLVNKTNQFNLTTRRRTEAELEELMHSATGMTLQVRLLDRFGDNGMIAVVICVACGADWRIDTWLMSCRVLNRRVEHATLNHVVESARAAGVRDLIGEYLRTDRNSIVHDHYARLGFLPVDVGAERSLWRLPVESYVPSAVPIQISREPAAPG